jgi:hypothetical protein
MMVVLRTAQVGQVDPALPGFAAMPSKEQRTA